MSFEHQFPYGDVNELNLDWIIQTMQEFINSEREAGHTPTVSSVKSFFTHKYPYGSIHELNLDWVIQTALRMEEIGDSVEGDIGALQTRMTAAEGNISTLDNTVSGLSDSVDQIETEIGNINDDVGALETTSAQHTAQIAALDDKIDTQVVANPAGAATDTLNKIEIAGAVYGVEGSGGSEVEANPTGEPTDTLETIGIDGTVYEVGGSAPVSKTAKGNPIHIEDAADAPIVSGTVAFEPVQDLHGYDKPWAGGAGKNLVTPSLVMDTGTYNGVTSSIADETYHLSGTTNATGYYFGNINNYITLPAGTYTLSVFPNGTFGTITEIRLRKQSDSAKIVSVYVDTTESASFTLDSDTAVFVAVVDSRSPSGTTISGQFTIQIEKGSTASEYEPYSNICPIEGYTECEVEVTGKNKLPIPSNSQTINGVTWTVGSNGMLTASRTETNSNWSTLPLATLTLAAGTYKVVCGVASNDVMVTARQNDISGQILAQTSSNGAVATLILSAETTVFFSANFRPAYSGTNIAVNPMLLNGTETDTSFEPYQSKTYTIDLDGTRYGGKVYPVTGKMSDSMGHIASYAGETIGEPWLSDRDEYVAGTTPTTGAEVVYTLASPTIVQLTPEQIRTLEGTNNISTNMTTMSLEYITQDYQPLVKLIERSVGHHYSEQERVVGSWFGKPLYEKSWNVSIEIPSASANTWLSTGILTASVNCDTVVGGKLVDNSNQFILGNIGFIQQNTYFAINVPIGNRTITAVTIQYTKTTD